MIAVEGLVKTYRGAAAPALDGVSLSVARGEVVAVIGHNGAGKSTLFDLLVGLTRPDRGHRRCAVGAHRIGWCPQRR